MFWKKQQEKRIEFQSWFNYTVMLPDKEEEEQEVIIMGNYIIKNIGTETLNNPIICIRISPVDVRLGGKIGSASHTALTIDGSGDGAWEYIDKDWKEKSRETGEHWLKPKSNQLLMNESLAFSHELRFSLKQQTKFVNAEGFSYFDEMKSGSATLNKIMVNF